MKKLFIIAMFLAPVPCMAWGNFLLGMVLGGSGGKNTSAVGTTKAAVFLVTKTCRAQDYLFNINAVREIEFSFRKKDQARVYFLGKGGECIKETLKSFKTKLGGGTPTASEPGF